jgi:tyrosyl-tRNA synthetase
MTPAYDKNMVNTSPKKIEEVLSQSVIQILPDKKSLKQLMQKRKIKVYWGIDPTGRNIHLGHAIPLRKLKQFQDLGHEVILLVGSFTAQLGDPSGRDTKRKALSLSQVKKNMGVYKKEAAKIINLKKAKVKYNGDWLAKLKFDDLIKLASNFTIARLLERDMFQRRIKQKKEIWMNELLYPLMQGYDSIALDVDLEIGGNDQTFNMLVGRKLQRIYNKKEKFVLTTAMLAGLDGREMSKTFDNFVNISDKPNNMYGKIMSLRDDLITHYFELCTDFSLVKIKQIRRDLKAKKINPKNLKMKLAKEIVAIYHGAKKAEMAEKEFTKVFSRKKLPSKIKVFKSRKGKIAIIGLLKNTGYIDSASEAQRLIKQKAVKVDGILIDDWKKKVQVKKGTIIKIGKRRFTKVK